MSDMTLAEAYELLYRYFGEESAFMDQIKNTQTINEEDMLKISNMFHVIHQEWKSCIEVPRHIIQLLSTIVTRLSNYSSEDPTNRVFSHAYTEIGRGIESLFLDDSKILSEETARVIVMQQSVGLGPLWPELRHYRGLHKSHFQSLLEAIAVLIVADQSKEQLPKLTAGSMIRTQWLLFDFQLVYTGNKLQEIVDGANTFNQYLEKYLFG